MHVPQIDEDCKQKYVLIQVDVTCHDNNVSSCLLVRGARMADYHKDAARSTVHALAVMPDVSYRVLGGGRISHNPRERSIVVYGFSYGFPWPDGVTRHAEACELLRPVFPGYTVEASDAGY
jgi:hypothetical protein